jgi:hypothetical protein
MLLTNDRRNNNSVDDLVIVAGEAWTIEIEPSFSIYQEVVMVLLACI